MLPLYGLTGVEGGQYDVQRDAQGRYAEPTGIRQGLDTMAPQREMCVRTWLEARGAALVMLVVDIITGSNKVCKPPGTQECTSGSLVR
jgi:hypothetical protein